MVNVKVDKFPDDMSVGLFLGPPVRNFTPEQTLFIGKAMDFAGFKVNPGLIGKEVVLRILFASTIPTEFTGVIGDDGNLSLNNVRPNDGMRGMFNRV